eukprot:588578-Prymnesium_polylepis.1
MLRDATSAIESARVGDTELPLPSLAAFDAAFAVARRTVVGALREQVACRLHALDAHGVTAELRTYPKPTALIQRVVLGVLAWLGRGRKALRKWDVMKLHLKADLISAMAAATSELVSASSRRESLKATGGLSEEEMLADAPFPARVLFKWLQAREGGARAVGRRGAAG